MRLLKRLGAAAFAVALCMAPVAIAQTPAGEILVSEQRPAQGTVVLGEVTVEVHQKTVFSKASPRALLDQELRAKAAKLGADAVVGVTYDLNNPLMSSKGHHAKGIAVRLTSTALASVAPPAAPVAPPSRPVAAPAPLVTAPAAPTVVASAPAAASALISAARIVLSEQPAAPGAAVLGQVTAEVHQKTVFNKDSPRSLLDQELRAKAAKLGADAVVGVTYDFNNPLMSSKGNHAKGTAVRLTSGAPVSAAPAPALQPAPSAAVAAAPAPVASPRPIAPPAPMPAASTAAPLLVDGVLLSEGDLPGRAYKVVGAINAEVHIRTVRAKQKPRDLLDADLRAKAKAMGADAVIQIRYDFNNPLLSSKGNHAAGVAVKFDR